ncbi:response regulator receiver domain protein (CheY-like) [hydrothermal vent metagenome]|uniref:Response regulator receiver domain protein (CheY-like) n=1 Tax=hydrothermal vent metagenome TaxID=652676 RepID=A0A1W1BI43_9ZZZZ
MMNFKVLIIDDDYINRRLLISLLKKTLYKTETIESVDREDALEKCKENPDIQLIFLNIEMQNINNLNFLINYKADKALADVPIIAISSDDLRIKEMLTLGAYSFIVKPITEKKLLTAIMKSQTKQ